MNRFILFLFLYTILGIGCKSNKTQVVSDALCSIEATVQDYSGLDGCGKILLTHDGYKILPINPAVLDPYAVDSSVRISFIKKEDMMSTCMAENFMADITCVESYGQRPMAKECINANKVKELVWLKKSQVDQIYRIDHFKFLSDGWSYIVYSDSGEKSVFNCHGDLLCTYKDSPDPTCQTMISEMTFINTIYSVAPSK